MLEARPPSVAAGQPGPSGQAGAPAAEPEWQEAFSAEVARSVRELRASAGLSERAAARLLGTSQTQLRRMEDPRYLPSLRSLARLASAYGHKVRISFETKDARPARPAPKPPARAKPAAPRGKRFALKRASGRSRRRP